MDNSDILYIMGKMRTCIFIISTCLTLQVTAASENTSASSSEGVLSDQPAQPENPVSGVVPANQEEVTEEIIVIGQQLILNLQQQIYRAEDQAFEIFNELNDDDLYDVNCVMEANTGTLIKRRMCYPNFYHVATRNNALEYLGNIGSEATTYAVLSTSTRNVISYQFPIFKGKVRELVKEHPQLRDAMQELFTLTDELKKTRNTYHGIEAQ